MLARRRKARARASYSGTQNGQTVSYHVWCYDLSEHGWLGWTHTRQLVRVQRTAENPNTGKASVGNRYYVTSLPPDRLGPRAALMTPAAYGGARSMGLDYPAMCMTSLAMLMLVMADGYRRLSYTVGFGVCAGLAVLTKGQSAGLPSWRMRYWHLPRAR